MSFSVGGSSGSTSGTQTVDPDIKGPWRNLVGEAQSAAQIPYQDYLGGAGSSFLNSDAGAADRLVAPLNQYQQTGEQIAMDNAGLGLAGAGQAVGTLSNYAQGVAEQPVQAATANGISNVSAPGFGAVRDVAAGKLSNTDLSPYLNPYTDDVVNQSLNDIDLQRQRAINGNSSDATTAGGEGAWQGSRAGVADALTNEAALRQAADSSAQLRQAGYGQAVGAATTDIANSLQAQGENQTTDLNRAGQVYSGALQTAQHNQDAYNDLAKFNAQAQQAASTTNAGLYDNELNRAVQAAGQLTSAAQAQQALGQQQAQAYTDAGNARQQQQQNVLTALQQAFQNQTNFPSYQLGLQESAFGLAPKVDNGSVSQSNSSGKSAGVGGGLSKG